MFGPGWPPGGSGRGGRVLYWSLWMWLRKTRIYDHFILSCCHCIETISNTGSLLKTDNRIRESKQNPGKCNVTTSDKVFFLLLNSQVNDYVLTIVLLAAKRFPSAFHEVIPAFQAQVTLGRVDQSKLQRQRVHPSTCRSDYWYQAGVLSLGIEGLEQGTVYVLTWGQCLWWTAPETHNLKTTKTVAFLGMTPKKQKSRNPQTRALTKMRRNAHLAWRGADRRPTSGPYNDSEWGGCNMGVLNFPEFSVCCFLKDSWFAGGSLSDTW